MLLHNEIKNSSYISRVTVFKANYYYLMVLFSVLIINLYARFLLMVLLMPYNTFQILTNVAKRSAVVLKSVTMPLEGTRVIADKDSN